MTTQVTEKTETQPVTREEPTHNGEWFRPNVDIVETPDELIVFADVPGVTREELEIQFEAGTLTLHARVRSRHPKNATFLVREYGVGDFYRTFRVSEEIDGGTISAELQNGVLALHLPKAEKARPRKIEVKS
jgi:HSP20 family molecular chaperone IbpA